MSQKLLRYLQSEQSSSPSWKDIALREVLDVVERKTLAKKVWPELRQRGAKNRKSGR
jgi:hypothetical protein